MKNFGLLGVVALLAACGGGGNGGGGTSNATAGSSNNGGDPDSGMMAAAGTMNGSAGSSSGSNDAGSNGGGGMPAMTPTNVDQLLEVVQTACEADCVAIHATECAPTNVNRPTCELQCVVGTNNLGEFCLPEYAALVDCRASGGYACVNDFPTPEANCPTEQSAFSMCTIDLGCKRYCAKARDEGCGGESLDACIQECIAGRDDFPMSCNYRYDGLRQCQGTSQAECVDGTLAIDSQLCSYQVVSLAECIADEAMDLCSGWCFAAEQLGCPLENCETECPALMMDPTCGVQFTDMVDCGMFFSDVGCTDMRLVGTSICDTETTAYLLCLEMPPAMP